jgi:hypothetical protein
VEDPKKNPIDNITESPYWANLLITIILPMGKRPVVPALTSLLFPAVSVYRDLMGSRGEKGAGRL